MIEHSSKIKFAIGDISGHFVSDKLTLGIGTNNKKITIPNQKFGFIEHSRGIFDDPDIEAVIGLAYPVM